MKTGLAQVLAMVLLCGCTVGGPDNPHAGASTSPAPAQAIHLNQLGFRPSGLKQAVIVDTQSTQFRVLNAASRKVVFAGALSAAATWQPSGERVKLADFTSFAQVGEFLLEVDGRYSDAFRIDEDVYSALHAASLKSFYLARAGTALEPQFAGPWARPSGHPDTVVLVHRSAVDSKRAQGTSVSAPRGWYDAGDFNKYVVNSGISTFTLLAAFEHFPEAYQALDLNIPESGDGVPDILNEILWNLDWMEAMQDPNDGGVYHKLTTLKFAPMVMPHEAREPRYMVAKSTGATLNFAAVMAVAARVLATLDGEFADHIARYRQAALSAWQWAKVHPETGYEQPGDVHTGAYIREGFADEWIWAGVELFLLTQDASYLSPWEAATDPLSTPDWGNVGALAWISLAQHASILSADQRKRLKAGFARYAQQLERGQRISAYGITYGSHDNDFQWGGNAVALNQALMAIVAYRLDPRPQWLQLAQGNFNYVLGQNALGVSFVTGFGARSPQKIHHRVSVADGLEDPVPGLLAGGPNTNGQDRCDYPSKRPALSYVDSVCSFTTNEIAINWNAPLVYVAGALHYMALP